jgi:hypothetical protein
MALRRAGSSRPQSDTDEPRFLREKICVNLWPNPSRSGGICRPKKGEKRKKGDDVMDLVAAARGGQTGSPFAIASMQLLA